MFFLAGSVDVEVHLSRFCRVAGQYLLEHGVIICVSPPPLSNQQTTPEKRSEVDETVGTDSMPKERGKVFVRDVSPPDTRINNMTLSTRNARGKPSYSWSFTQVFLLDLKPQQNDQTFRF